MYGPRSDVALYIVRNISLQSLISFNLNCKKSSIMILDYNLTSPSSEGSDEPVHQTSAKSSQSIRCSYYILNMVADIDSIQILANTNNDYQNSNHQNCRRAIKILFLTEQQR